MSAPYLLPWLDDRHRTVPACCSARGTLLLSQPHASQPTLPFSLPHHPSAGRGGGVDLSALSIVSGKTCWVVFADALLLNIGGNLHDAVSIAAKVRAGSGEFCRGQEAGDGALACVGGRLGGQASRRCVLGPAGG